jgi:hypothetical protein
MSQGSPLRLRDDPSMPRALRDDLARATSASVAGYDIAAGVAKFEHALQTGAGGAGAGSSAASATVGGAVLKGTLLGVVAVGAATLLGDHTPTAVPAASRTEVRVVASARREDRRESAPGLPPSASSPPASTSKPSPLDAQGSAVASARASARTAATTAGVGAGGAGGGVTVPKAAAPTRDPLVEETEHMARMRAIGDSDPAQAFALAEEGQRRFPSGLFAQEREAVAIGALAHLGRAAEARARAKVFLASYPRSSFAERIRKLLATSEGATDRRP